jgi:lysophospholipase L1-like esterase
MLLAGCLLGMTCVWAQPAPAAPAPDISHAVSYMQSLTGPAPAPVAFSLQPGDKLAFMGDSITDMGGYVRLAEFVLNANYPDLKPVIIKVGRGGNRAEDMEPRFVKDMRLAEKPAWCFISAGINDVWGRLGAPDDPAVLAAYRVNVAKMVDEAQAAGSQAVILTPTLIGEDPHQLGNDRLIPYVEAEKQIAAEKKCALVDLHGMFLAALATKPADLHLTIDGIHMNAYGDTIMAIGVLRALGVSDATMAATDISPAFRVSSWGITLAQAATLLEVPITRFYKPDLARFLGF